MTERELVVFLVGFLYGNGIPHVFNMEQQELLSSTFASVRKAERRTIYTDLQLAIDSPQQLWERASGYYQKEIAPQRTKLRNGMKSLTDRFTGLFRRTRKTQ